MLDKIFDNDLVVIRKNKVTLTLSKFTYIEMCILELTKVLMYGFHYDYIKNKYGNNSKLSFKGTDSLLYEIKTEDVYKDFKMYSYLVDDKSEHKKQKVRTEMLFQQ